MNACLMKWWVDGVQRMLTWTVQVDQELSHQQALGSLFAPAEADSNCWVPSKMYRYVCMGGRTFSDGSLSWGMRLLLGSTAAIKLQKTEVWKSEEGAGSWDMRELYPGLLC